MDLFDCSVTNDYVSFFFVLGILCTQLGFRSIASRAGSKAAVPNSTTCNASIAFKSVLKAKRNTLRRECDAILL